MGQFNGKRVCGVRAGLPFKDVLRVNQDGHCPDGTSPCSLSKSIENQLCYRPEEHDTVCPITSMKIVTQTGIDSLRAQGYKVVDYSVLDGHPTFLAFSKHEDSLPLTSIRIEHKPCFDSW